MSENISNDSVVEKEKRGLSVFGFLGMLLGLVALSLTIVSFAQIDMNNTEQERFNLLENQGFMNVEEYTDFDGDSYISAERDGTFYKFDFSSGGEGKETLEIAVDAERNLGSVQTVEIEK